MSEPKTPNLGLNKIDRSSPSTTYFDLDKYLDQNWEKIDEFAEQVGEQAEETEAKVSEIQERLDVEKRRSVTLEPGVQIIHGERASTFKLEGLKGRTLLNLLGHDGGFESMSGWFTTAGVESELDSSLKTQGNQSVKISLKEGSTGGSLYKLLGQTLSTSKNYIALADLKKGTSTSVSLSLWNGTSNVTGTVITTDHFSTAALLIPATSLGAATNNLQISIVGNAKGQFGHVDAVRLYEITSDELKAVSNMNLKQVANRYAYVDSIQSVRNPYVIRYGENLLPPFYEWSTGALAGSNTLDAPYRLKMVKANGATGFNTLAVNVNVAPLTDYTLSITVDISNIGGDVSVGAYWNAAAYSEDGKAIENYTQGPFVTTNGTKTMVRSFSTPENTKYIRFIVGLDNGTTGTAVFRDVTLNTGTTAKPFKPCEESILALQTELHANPDTGANPDSVFERDGQYFKLAKWCKLTLNGNLPYAIYTNESTDGFKRVRVNSYPAYNPVDWSPVGVKFNGTRLSRGNIEIVDALYGSTDGSLLAINVSNADSGWGDLYTPTADEIKAYFMGWRMYDGGQKGNPYNSTGTKTWNSIKHWGTPTYFTTTLPTIEAPSWTPYQLLYQLATPVVEQITSEGQLTFIDGSNQVEVGTGLVVREGTKPPLSTIYNTYEINSVNTVGSVAPNPLKYKAGKVLTIYKNNRQDTWKRNSDNNSYGLERAYLNASLFDPSAAYSVTYLMLDKYPATDITGTYAKNEKALLLDTVKTLEDNTTRISVLESKKAEKDNPAWITPTLVNGWANYSDLYQPIRYYKDSQGEVHLSGVIRGGVNTSGTSITRLPVAYRPKKAMIFNVFTSNSTALVSASVEIAPDGVVYLGFAGGNTWLNLENISFLAEQ